MLLAALLGAGNAAGGVVLLLGEIPAGEFAVIAVLEHGEIHIAIHRIGGPSGLKVADQVADRIEAAGGPRHSGGGKDVEGGHVGHEGLDVAFAHRLHRAALGGGAGEDLVVDVGVILHKGHLIAQPEQVTAQHIPHDVAAGMAEVAEVVDGDAAAVDRDLARAEGHEVGLGPGEGVGEPQGQGEGRTGAGERRIGCTVRPGLGGGLRNSWRWKPSP